MVVLPPPGDLRHPAFRWQTVFASTAPLAEKSMQNADRCDIQATVSMQPRKSQAVEPRLFRNTEQWISAPAEGGRQPLEPL
jgi:hypothetical protein